MELAVGYKTLQLSAIIAILHDLTELAAPKEMEIETAHYPHLHQPPQADCHRYDALLSSKGEAA